MERVRAVEVSAYTVPTDGPEEDGTMAWHSTTMVVVEVTAGDRTGIGYTYGATAAAHLVRGELAEVVVGADVGRRAGTWNAMRAALRNAGRPGIGMMAVAAVDVALWDLHAKLLDLPVVDLMGAAHERVPVYGSGGFCNYSLEKLAEQTGGWAAQGIPRVKIKTSRHPEEDPARLDAVRKAIGDDTELFCDANGALTRKDALWWAERFRHEWGVRWFEEPVSSDDLDGLRLLRDQGPAGLDIAAGEYGFILSDFRNLVVGGCVDCLQADVTRCGGITGMLLVGGLCAAHQLELSGHCAPALSAHALCGVPLLRHLEYFFDHTRIEAMAFDGTLEPAGGCLEPDRSRPGLGLELRRQDMERYRVL
ncbi:MAG: enolase C-terminal domain-like protein [Acidimicrobiales bacterium]